MATVGSDVTVRMTSDMLDVLRDWQKHNEQIIKNQRQLMKFGRTAKRAGNETKKSVDDSTVSWRKMAFRVSAAATAVELVRRTVAAAVQENLRLSQSIDEIVNKARDAELKLQVQAGQTPAQFERQIPQIRKALLQTPSTDFFGAIEIQKQLVSSGFRQKDIKSGDALQTVLDLQAATNQFGRDIGDPKEAVKSVAQFLKAQGFDRPTASQIRATGGRLTTLFEGSDIQFPDLSDLAGEASVLRERNVSQIEQLAAFSTLRDVKDSPEAATGLRQVVSRMATFANAPAKVNALRDIGLKPKDVDLVGEEFVPALKRLNAALEGVGDVQQNLVLNKLFGEKGETAAAILLGSLPTIEKRVALQKDPVAFERNLALFQRSRFARNQRFKIREQFALRDRDLEGGAISFDELRQIGDTLDAEGKLGGLGVVLGLGKLGLSVAEKFRVRPKQLGHVARGIAPAFGVDLEENTLSTQDPEVELARFRNRLPEGIARKFDVIVDTLKQIAQQQVQQKVQVVNDPARDRVKSPRRKPIAENSRR